MGTIMKGNESNDEVYNIKSEDVTMTPVSNIVNYLTRTVQTLWQMQT